MSTTSTVPICTFVNPRGKKCQREVSRVWGSFGMAWGNYCTRHAEAGELREAQRKEVHEARQKLEETAAQAALYEEILHNRGDTIFSREELIARCGRLSAIAISLLGEKRDVDVRLVMQDRKLWTEQIAAWDKSEAERARRAALQGQGLTKKERKKAIRKKTSSTKAKGAAAK